MKNISTTEKKVSPLHDDPSGLGHRDNEQMQNEKAMSMDLGENSKSSNRKNLIDEFDKQKDKN